MTFDPRELEGRIRALPPSPSQTKLDLRHLIQSVSLSRTSDGAPCLVFEVIDRPTPADQSTWALRTIIHPQAEIIVDGAPRKSAIVVVALTDTSFLWHFAILIAAIANALTVRIDAFSTSRGVCDHLLQWADVFRQQEITYETELGLWGELHVLEMLENVERAVDVWRGPEAGIFDFDANDIALEVKTSERRRRHWFNLRQIPEGHKPRVLIASVITQKDPVFGETVADKAERVRSMLSSSARFDEKLARVGFVPTTSTHVKVRLLQVVFVAGADIPRPRQIDEGIEEVKFLVDITDVPPLPEGESSVLIARLLGVTDLQSRS